MFVVPWAGALNSEAVSEAALCCQIGAALQQLLAERLMISDPFGGVMNHDAFEAGW